MSGLKVESRVIVNGYNKLETISPKFSVRYKIMDGDKLVGLALQYRFDTPVRLELAKELVKLDLIRSVELKDGELDFRNGIDNMEASPFVSSEKLEESPKRTTEDMVAILNETFLEIQNEAIDQRFEGGGHFPIVCDECGCMYHTKNIGSIGRRSIFAKSSLKDCKHSVKSLRVLNDKEFKEFVRRISRDAASKIEERVKLYFKDSSEDMDYIVDYISRECKSYVNDIDSFTDTLMESYIMKDLAAHMDSRESVRKRLSVLLSRVATEKEVQYVLSNSPEYSKDVEANEGKELEEIMLNKLIDTIE